MASLNAGNTRVAQGVRGWLEGESTIARRGFILLGIMTASYGTAMAIQQNIVTNYFEDVLHLAGPQFGYITAIREVPGFLLILLTALFYKMSIPRLTALALVLLTIGYGLFGLSHSFWTVAPWVVISSMGYHTVLQTQYALGMSLTKESRSGSILGKMQAIRNGGALVAMVLVLVAFHYKWLTFRPTFVIAAGLAAIAAVAIFSFPNLHNGEVQEHRAARDPIVLRKPYRLYYYLCVLDGARQQIFFSFGLWVLVNQFSMSVPQISALLVVVNLSAIFFGPWMGRMIDARGEKRMLGIVNIGYVVALAAYALMPNVILAAGAYAIYTIIMPLSTMGSSTYLRKVAVSSELAPSLAMGVTLQHMAAIVVPIAAGFILNFVGYQIPFFIACIFSLFAIVVTQRLDPLTQRSPARVAEDEERELAGAAVLTNGTP